MKLIERISCIAAYCLEAQEISKKSGFRVLTDLVEFLGYTGQKA